MMMKGESLVEEVEEQLVDPVATGVSIKRTGRFLKPRANSASDVAISAVPSLRSTVSSGQIFWPPKKVVLEGWRSPQPKWREWVERLRKIYQPIWKKAGIYDAVIVSTYEIRRHPSVFFALLLYWCPETNTFAFPWAEATFTLEDVMILGGFPVDGEPVMLKETLSGGDREMLLKMVTERKGFNKLSSKKASHYEWIKHYMEVGRGDELEHIAFLSLWLSRFVFPAHPGKTVSELMFPIAIRLAQGTRIALGPAVLASVYRDLRILRDYTVSMGGEEASSNFTVWAPFQLLLLWAWEHFVALRTEICPNPLQANEPRASRWHGLDVKLDLLYVVSVLESPEEFQWRPYMMYIGDWHPPSFHKDEGHWISLRMDNNNEDIGSYVRILRACELVGVDCIEQYLPHRVAMQFGLDQDIPGHVPRANANWELAWRTYDKCVENAKLYAPPRLFESDCTQRFFIWQHEGWVVHDSTGENFMGQLEQSQQEKHTSPQQEKCTSPQQEKRTSPQQEKQLDTQASPESKSTKSEDHTDSLPELETYDNGNAIKQENGLIFETLSTGNNVQKLHLSKMERKLSRKRMLSKIYGTKFRQGYSLHQVNKYDLHQVKDVTFKQGDDAFPGELYDIEVKRIANGAKENMIRSFHVPKMVEGLKNTFSPLYNSFRIKEREQKAARLRKEMELDAQIERIKAEIAELEADMMNMDFMNEFEGIFFPTT